MSIKQGAVKISELQSVKGKFSLAGKKAIVTGRRARLLPRGARNLPDWSSDHGHLLLENQRRAASARC